MKTKVGINGFGRIGRICTRILIDRSDEFELCAINLRKSDIPHMAYMLKYDSALGRFNGTIKEGKDYIEINGHKVTVLSYDNPSDIPWSSAGAEYVIDADGKVLFTIRDADSPPTGTEDILQAPAHGLIGIRDGGFVEVSAENHATPLGQMVEIVLQCLSLQSPIAGAG